MVGPGFIPLRMEALFFAFFSFLYLIEEGGLPTLEGSHQEQRSG